MTREDIPTKARRYVAESRITLAKVGPHSVRATARGDGAVYTVTYRRGRWRCSCPARGNCCHMTGARLVTSPKPRKGWLRWIP